MSDLKKKQLTLLKAAALLLLFGTPLVSAQNTGYELEEIIVTANKRDEQSLQDIAGSVQAISSRTLVLRPTVFPLFYPDLFEVR